MKIKFEMEMILSIYMMIIACSIANGQNGFVAIGGDHNSSVGSISQSAGVLTHKTVKNNSITVMQGIQHPLFVTVINSTDNFENPEIQIYPNPTSNHLQIREVNDDFNIRRCQIIDLSGNVVLEQELRGSWNTINLENLPPTTYHITLIGRGDLTYTYKIIKI